MKLFIACVAFVAVFGIGSVVEAQQTIAGSVVVPSLVPGYNFSIFENVVRRQQVYVTTGFPATGVITKMAFRRPFANFPAGGGILINFRMTFSTTTLGPNGLSPIFDLNTGLDATVVFDGSLTFPHLPGNQGCSPLGNEFVYIIPFAQPFSFNGGGNLLLELQVFVGSGYQGNGYQSYAASPSEVSSIVATGSNPTAFVGLPVDAGYVTLFQFSETPASVTIYGNGCPQSNSVAPQIDTANLPTVGSFCSPFTVRLANAIPFTVAILAASTAQANIPLIPLPGCALLVDPDPMRFAYYLVGTNGNGSAQKDFSIPNEASLIGGSIYFQWAVIDGGIGLPYPFAFTQGLQATIGI